MTRAAQIIALQLVLGARDALALAGFIAAILLLLVVLR